jgi:hypothetical protein
MKNSPDNNHRSRDSAHTTSQHLTGLFWPDLEFLFSSVALYNKLDPPPPHDPKKC